MPKQFITERLMGKQAINRPKYLQIVVAVALFVLLDSGVLILNFYTSYQIANDAHAIQLASRMGTLTQSILQQLCQVRDDARDASKAYQPAVDRFARSYKAFDEALDSFIYGGAMIGEGQGQDALLEDTTYRDTDAAILKEAESLWQSHRPLLKPVVYAYFNGLSRELVAEHADAAIAHARLHSEPLLSLMERFALAVEGVAQRKAERLRLIQTVGIGLAVLNFFLILFHFLRKLRQGDLQLEKARKETEEILRNVSEGLFLLDRSGMIGAQHSTSLGTLFGRESLAGTRLLDLLQPLVTAKTLELVQDYIEILFSQQVEESLVADLNPLKEVEIHLGCDGAAFDLRYFSFQFSRVYQGADLEALLVTVRDVTEQVRLAEKLRIAREKASREIETLLTVSHLEPTQLKSFLASLRQGLDAVNATLRSPDQGTVHLKSKIEAIARIIHRLKGDSSALGIAFLEEGLHRFESAMAPLREKGEISGEDFLPLVVQLNQLMTEFSAIDTLMRRMEQFGLSGRDGASIDHGGAAADSPKETAGLEAVYTRLVKRVAEQSGKEAALQTAGLDLSALSPAQSAAVHDIAVQCLRNAVVHGLESPEIRQRAGKPRCGTITLTLNGDAERVGLVVRDDGRGIDLEAVKEKALRTGLVDRGQSTAWTPAQWVQLLFRPGFTTAAEAGLHAGRGVGLELIRRRLEDLGGRVRVGFQPGRFTEFHFQFERRRVSAQRA